MVDLKISRRAAILTSPPIARKHLASELTIRRQFKPQPRAFERVEGSSSPSRTSDGSRFSFARSAPKFDRDHGRFTAVNRFPLQRTAARNADKWRSIASSGSYFWRESARGGGEVGVNTLSIETL